MGRPYIDIAGKTFSRLLVLRPANNRSRHGEVRWICRCQCGKKITTTGHRLRSGQSKSCGCGVGFIHGEAEGVRYSITKEYRAWKGMWARVRCKPGDRNYRWYRKIKVCKAWQDFRTFLRDMGRAPSPHHSLDRINSVGDYKPSNCRWATTLEQGNNKRNTRMLTLNGEKLSIADWARRLCL